jgi:hypothetical protein
MESLMLPRLLGGEAQIGVLDFHAHVNAMNLKAIGFSPSARADADMPRASLKCPARTVKVRVIRSTEQSTPKNNRIVIGIRLDTPHRHARDSYGQSAQHKLYKKSFHRAIRLRCTPSETSCSHTTVIRLKLPAGSDEGKTRSLL